MLEDFKVKDLLIISLLEQSRRQCHLCRLVPHLRHQQVLGASVQIGACWDDLV